MTVATQTIQLPAQTRYLTIPIAAEASSIVDPNTREVSFAFSSETPVERINWDTWSVINEVLSHDPTAADLGRCNSGVAPLLWNHNPDDQRGVVVKAWIDQAERRGWCTVRFSRSAAGKQLMQDVNDRIVSAVSFRYQIKELVLSSQVAGELDTYTATNWEVLEICFCSIPADPTVGIGRSQDQQFSVKVVSPNKSEEPMTEETKTITTDDALRQQNEDLQRQLAELKAAHAESQRQAEVTSQYGRLKDQARQLVSDRKLSTAAYEAMFSDAALKRYLAPGSVELANVEFHLRQVEKFGPANSALAPSPIADQPLPDHPQDRTEERQADAAAAQRLADKAAGVRSVVL